MTVEGEMAEGENRPEDSRLVSLGTFDLDKALHLLTY